MRPSITAKGTAGVSTPSLSIDSVPEGLCPLSQEKIDVVCFYSALGKETTVYSQMIQKQRAGSGFSNGGAVCIQLISTQITIISSGQNR